MNGRTIITIGRQYGSGGHEIGEKLAQALEVPFYDRELLTVAAKESGMSEEIFESYDETPASSLLYSLSMGTYTMGGPGGTAMQFPIHHKVFLAQFDAIRALAKQGPCVIVGRCADYALADYPHCVNVFIHASMENRVRRIAALHNLSDKEAEAVIRKTDKRRASYYNFYSDKKWEQADSYHLTIDSGVGIDSAVELIRLYANLWDGKAKR